MTERRYSDLSLYRRILSFARPYWTRIAGVFWLSLLATPIALLVPVPLKIAVDSVLGDHPLPGFLDPVVPDVLAATPSGRLWVAAGLVVAVALVRQVQQTAASVLQTSTGQKILLRFRSMLFARAQRLSLAYHDRRGAAESTYRIQWDAPSIHQVAIQGVIPFLTAGVTVVAMLAVAARIDPVLALVAFGVTPILIVLVRIYRKPLRRRYRQVRELDSSALSVVQEVLPAVRVVKAFGQEEKEERRFRTRSRDTVRARIRLTLFQGGFDALTGVTTAVGTAFVLLVGVRHVQQGVLTLGDLLVVMAYITQLYVPLRTISNKAADIQSALAGAERAFALLDETPEVPEQPHPRRLDRAHGLVEFRRVAFRYRADQPLLRDVTFEVEPGQSVGISGPTGAGKTTIVNLLTRFYDPDGGQILLDGVDVREYRVTDLRAQFAIVLQDPVLFSTTIGENIAYARPDADEEAIVEAARAAGAHGFIERLPQGYDTEVGERGMMLSGGERQRVSLARAFLKDAPLLVLDEPTSSVDVETEARIMDAMRRLMVGRTTFMIAHRLSTLESCDIRLRVHDGRVRPLEHDPKKHADPLSA